MITPFLDWTEKPYIAAFFAFTDYLEQLSRGGRRFRERTERKVAIYRLIQEANLVGVRSEGTFHILRPSVNELSRMHRQRSVFTFLDSYTFFELQGYFNAIGMGDALTQFVMPDRVIDSALRDLELHGIDYLSLFPDLEGAARQANAEWRNSPLGKIES